MAMRLQFPEIEDKRAAAEVPNPTLFLDSVCMLGVVIGISFSGARKFFSALLRSGGLNVSVAEF